MHFASQSVKNVSKIGGTYGSEKEERNGLQTPERDPHCRSCGSGSFKGPGRKWAFNTARDVGRILREVRYRLGKSVLKGKKKSLAGRPDRKREGGLHLRYLQRCFKELSLLRPEMIEMFNGMAQGAMRELDQCVHAKACTHFEKIALANYSSTRALHPDWDFDKDRPAPGTGVRREPRLKKVTAMVSGSRGGHPDGTHVRNPDRPVEEHRTGGSGRERQVSYVAIPKDPSARVFWGTAGRQSRRDRRRSDK